MEFPPDLPVALYTGNMGLALKVMPQQTVPEGEAVRFQDINIDILSGKYRTRAPRMPMRYKLFSLAMVIAIGLLFPLYYLKNEAAADTVSLQTELDGISQELSQARLLFNEAQQIQDAIDEIDATIDALQQEYRDIMDKGGDFTNYLRVVTNVLPSKAYVTSIVIGTNQILVEGEADSSFTVITYAMSLEARGELSDVRIAEIGEGEGTELSFTIIIFK